MHCIICIELRLLITFKFSEFNLIKCKFPSYVALKWQIYGWRGKMHCLDRIPPVDLVMFVLSVQKEEEGGGGRCR